VQVEQRPREENGVHVQFPDAQEGVKAGRILALFTPLATALVMVIEGLLPVRRVFPPVAVVN